MLSLLTSILLFGLISFDVFRLSDSSDLIVNTTLGPIQGFQYTWQKDSSIVVNAWRGIPFASPPVGDFRWKAPQAASGWTEVLPCKSNKPYCVQPSGVGSEDCLYLNVYSTVYPKDNPPYPVLYYIYGGSLMSGSATEDFSSFIARAGSGKGVVVVTVAYRVNIFGFLATAELSAEQGGHSGNYGILDQQAGLRWVQDNIAAFGGDPTRVTVAGQSSGGTSIFALMSSPASKGLFHAAISLSGSPNISLSLSKAELQNAPIVKASGCLDLACLRAQDVKSLVKLIPESWSTPGQWKGIWSLPKGPQGEGWDGLVIVDGQTVTMPFSEALSSGLVDVPFLFGNMAFEPDEYPDQDVSALSLTDWKNFLQKSFSTWPNSAEVSQSMYDLYEPLSSENPQKAFDAIVTDYGLFCGQLALVRQAAAPIGRYSSPIYLFENHWGLSQPFVTGGREVRYPFHYLDYLMLTDGWTSLGNGTYSPSDSDLQARDLLQQTWYQLMSSLKLDRIGSTMWRTVDSATEWPNHYAVMVIQAGKDGYSNTTIIRDHKSDICDYYSTINLDAPQFWWCN